MATVRTRSAMTAGALDARRSIGGMRARSPNDGGGWVVSTASGPASVGRFTCFHAAG